MTKDDADFLIVHGDQDRLVPFQQSELLHKRLGDAGVNSLFIRMTGGGHGFRHPDLQKRMELFIRRSFEMDDVHVNVSDEPIQVRDRR